jgi:hypothetical protein
MWRLLILAAALLASAAAAPAGALDWDVCRGRAGPAGPVLEDCRSLDGVIDPQGRDLWLRAVVPAPEDAGPHALHIVGVAASESWLNAVRLGANGQPGGSAEEERPGLYQSAFVIRHDLWRPGDNVLVVRLSSFHGALRLDHPVGAILVAPYPLPGRGIMLAVTFVAAGALLAATFGFGVIHAIRQTPSSRTLAAMAALAALQAVAESFRSLVPYAYPLHVWRLGLIWALAAGFAVLLASYAAARFAPRAGPALTGLAAVAVAATLLIPGFDSKTGWALVIGAGVAAGAAAIGLRHRRPGAAACLVWLALFLGVAVLLPEWLLDLSFFLLAAGLILPLLMVEVIRLGREDQGREAALTRATEQPDRLAVASSRGVELVPTSDIVAAVGADDYVELRLTDGRRLLHATRLDRLEARLPPGFLRIHRSVIANLAFARGYSRDGGRCTLQMQDGQALPVSRRRLAGVRDALGDAAPDRSAADI